MRGLFLLPLLALPTNAAASTYFGATVSLQEALTGDPDLVDVSSLSIVSQILMENGDRASFGCSDVGQVYIPWISIIGDLQTINEILITCV